MNLTFSCCHLEICNNCFKYATFSVGTKPWNPRSRPADEHCSLPAFSLPFASRFLSGAFAAPPVPMLLSLFSSSYYLVISANPKVLSCTQSLALAIV